MKDFFNNKKPVPIEMGEWWFNGCIIQKQNHPILSKYSSFKDSDNEFPYVQTYSTFKQAIKGVLQDGCKEPSRHPKDYGVGVPLTD